MKQFLLAKIVGILLTFVCVVCGGKAHGQSRTGLQDNTDRVGGDFSVVQVSSADACRQQCLNASRCLAFTFEKPSAGKSASSCWLKSTVPPSTDDSRYVSGMKGGTLDLSVVTANMKGNSDLPESGGPGAIDWRARFQRLASSIAVSGAAPDLISITEFDAWTWCVGPWTVGDYESLEVLVTALQRQTGVNYRIAYMVGQQGSYGGIARTRCQYFQGDTVLYNPARLVNLTPHDLSGRTLQRHDAAYYGLQLRRSLPYCHPGSTGSELIEQIDGGLQSEKCSQVTRTGPAWALVMRGTTIDGVQWDKVVASLARFAFQHDSRASFDLFTIHPSSGNEFELTQPTIDFIETLSVQPFRNQGATLPTLVIGDMNALAHTSWLRNFNEVGGPSVEPVMSVMTGIPHGVVSPRLGVASVTATKLTLPLNSTRCGPYPDEQQFSDHCALRVDFADVTGVRPNPVLPPNKPKPTTPKGKPMQPCLLKPWLPQCKK